MRTHQSYLSMFRAFRVGVTIFSVACMISLVFVRAGPPTMTDKSVKSNEDLRKLLDDAFEALDNPDAPSHLSVEEKGAWRDKLLAAVPSKPSSPLEAGILMEAGKVLTEIGPVPKLRSLLLDVAGTPAAGWPSRMNAAQQFIGIHRFGADPQVIVQVLDWYAEAAREREREPDKHLRQGYTMARDPMVRGAAFYRGMAFLDAAKPQRLGDVSRKDYAARAISEFDSYLGSDFGSDTTRSYPASRRYVLFHKGMAYAILEDEQAVLKIAAELERTPVVNIKSLEESIGFFLFNASKLAAQASQPAKPDPVQMPMGRALLRRFEGLVPPEDPYYVEFQRELARADEGEHKWKECVARTDNILNSSVPQVRAYLEANPASWGGTLYLHGECLMHLGRREEAQKAFRELLSRFPDNGNAPVARVRLENNW